MSAADPDGARSSAEVQSLRAAGLLAACAVLAAGLLLGSEWLGRERIVEARQHAQRQALQVVLPEQLHDNDPLADSVLVQAPHWLGSTEPLPVLRARLRHDDRALVLQALAPDGYGGPIRLLIAVAIDGRVLGVRISEHRETPGLGDYIDAARSNWIDGFAGRMLGEPPVESWAVRRDGGEFDQMAGATVSARAVVAAVARTLAYVQRHGQQLYAAPSGQLLEHRDGPDPATLDH